mgnify:CR=1 FL=1|jgi:hypothetical protein
MIRVLARMRALRRARDRAQNVEFKKLWQNKMDQLLDLHV